MGVPRLCRGGSNSLTFPGVGLPERDRVQRERSRALIGRWTQAGDAKHGADDVRLVSAREGAKTGCFQCCGLAMTPIRVAWLAATAALSGSNLKAPGSAGDTSRI